MSLAERAKLTRLEEQIAQLQRQFADFCAKFDRVMKNVDSLAVVAALEREAFTIPPPPRCLHELGLV